MRTSDLIFTLKQLCKCECRSQIQQVHAHAITTALFSLDPSPLLTHILHSFISSSLQRPNTIAYDLIYCTNIFDLIPNPSTFNYNDIIRAHALLHSPRTAFTFFLEMRRRPIAPNSHTFPYVFKACGLLQNSHSLAKALHAQLTKFGFSDYVYVCNTLCCAYGRSGDVRGAEAVFEGNSVRDAVSYNSMIDVFIKAQEFDCARDLFDEMPHSFRNVVSYTTMIDGLFKAGAFDHARVLFDEMPHSFRDVVTYNAMIHGLFKAGDFDRARGLFDEMPRSFRDVVTYNAMIDGLFKAGDIDHARELFDEIPILIRNVVTYTAMIDGFCKAGQINSARELFNEMPTSFRNMVTYNALIDGLCKAGDIDRARELFDEMPISSRDVVTYNVVIDGLCKAGDIDHAMELFNEIPISFKNVVTYNAVIDGLCKAGDIDHARDLFDEMPISFRDGVTYNTMIDGFCKAGQISCARDLFDEMPTSLRNVLTYNTMIDGLCKAGDIDHARELFDKMPISIRNVVSYNAMLMGLAMHGHDRSVLEQYLSRMVEDGFQPDGVTILSVLVSCSHSGLINDAKRIFMEMESVYGVQQEIQHYGCMVGLLARAGLIKEAREFIEGMPMEGEPYASAWGALLGGCKTYGDVEVAEEAAKHLMLAEPDGGAVFSSLVHIYANLGQWDEVVKVRRLRGRPGVKKRCGCSTIELDGITHNFFPGGGSKEICLILNDLIASTSSIHKLGV